MNESDIEYDMTRKVWCETCARAVHPTGEVSWEGWSGLECPGSKTSNLLSESTVIALTGCSRSLLDHAASNGRVSPLPCPQLGWVFEAASVGQWIRDGLPGIHE